MCISVIHFFSWVNVTVIVVICLNRWWVLVTSLSIRLSNSVLKLVDGLLLKLFPHLVLLSIPRIFLLTLFIDINTSSLLSIEGRLRMSAVLVDFAVARSTTSWVVWGSHIKHNVIELLIVMLWNVAIVASFVSVIVVV